MTISSLDDIPTARQTEPLFQEARELFIEGRYTEAAKLFNTILNRQNGHPKANYYAGLIQLHHNQPLVALDYFQASLDASPDCIQFLLAYIDALDQAGQSEMATSTMEIAIIAILNEVTEETLSLKKGIDDTTCPDEKEIDTIIHHYRNNHLEECKKCLEALLSRFPTHGFSWKILGAVLKQENSHDEALVAMEKAVLLLPDDPQAFNNLGIIFKDKGTLGLSVLAFQKALRLDNSFTEAYNNLGVTLMDQGQLVESEQCFQKALHFRSDYVEAWCNLGTNYKNQGKYADAEKHLRKGIDINPTATECLNNLGNLYQGRGRLQEAEEVLLKALDIKPDFAVAYNNLGNVYQGQGDHEKASTCYKKALDIQTDYADAFDSLLFVSNYDVHKSAKEIFQLYEKYDKQFGIPCQDLWKPHHNTIDTHRRLKVGYVSPAFFKHSAVNFILPLLENHNRTKFEVYAYAELMREDYATIQCREYVDHWVPTVGMSDDELADRIRADGIDILVDLAGHTDKNRLAVFARKPAPVSLHWLDFGYTTGLSAIDYYLTDPQNAPMGSENLFSEQLWRLPVPAVIYRSNASMGDVSSLPALKNGYITFGTLTRAIRINDRTIQTWSAALKQVKNSRLVINSNNFRDPNMQESLKKKFMSHGISEEQLEIGFNSPPWDLMRTIDISLDCFPHNSGTTLIESLYMGVPFITLADRPSVGRLGSSLLHGIQHTEWIAHTEEEYIHKLVTLANNIPELANTRRTLRHELQNSPLMDEAGFTVAVEDAYRTMFTKWTKQQTNQSSSMLVPEAIPAYNKAIKFQQDNLLSEAKDSYIQSINIQNNYPAAYNNLGVVYQQNSQYHDAEQCFLLALSLKPDDTDARYNLANTYKLQSCLLQAEENYIIVIKQKPNHVQALYNLGNNLQEQGRVQEAVQYLQEAVRLKPDDLNIFSTLLFSLNYHPDKSSEEIFISYQELNKRFFQPQNVHWLPHSNSRNLNRRIRIGYVAPDYRTHPTRFFLTPLLENHNKKAFEIFAYVQTQEPNIQKDFFFPYAEHWLNSSELSDDALCEQIRKDKIDILVDLAGHTAGNRLMVFARRPAPVSFHWLDYGYSTGLTAIDYYLTDRQTVPPDSIQYFSEEPWYLDTPSVAYKPPENTGKVNALPALKNNYITFGTLTRAVRINHKTIRVWSDILNACHHSRLIIDSSSFREKGIQDRLIHSFQQFGIQKDRLQIGFHTPPWDVLRKIDIMLDCFPHNSGTTLVESLFMGVPFITLNDRPGMGRLGGAFLKGIGHSEWIAKTEEEYISKALLLADNPDILAKIRTNLRSEMRNSPLMDGAGFTKKMEDSYKNMFSRWCADNTLRKDLNIQKDQSFVNKKKDKKKKNAFNNNKRKLSSHKPSPGQIKKLSRLFDTGNHDKALKLARSMGKRFPEHGFPWKVLGVLLFQKGLKEEGIQAMKKATLLLPNDSDTHFNLGIALQQSNLLQDALVSYGKATQINNRYTDAYYNTANILQKNGRHKDAEENYLHVLRIRPDHFEALCNLGNTQKALHKFDQAIQSYNSALKIRPSSAALFSNIGLLYTEKGLYDQAEAACKQALTLQPQLSDAHNNLGRVFQIRGQMQEAENCYHNALKHNNRNSNAYCNLGIALQQQGKLIKAVDSFREALLFDQSNPKLYQSLGVTQIKNGQFDEAEINLRKAISLQPDYRETYSNLLFLLNYHPDKSAEEIFSEYKQFNKHFFGHLKNNRHLFHNNRDGNRKLKIGYVSSNFRKHSTHLFLEPLLSCHDKTSVEVFLYADLSNGDAITERYKTYADHWKETNTLTDEELADHIRTDSIDVLVELAGHTEGNRLGMFALKPAPVSLHWLDYGYTTGLDTIDYYLTDTVTVPEDSTHLFSEKPWRMEPPWFVYRPAEGMGQTDELPALSNGYITFGTLTRTIRINYKTIRVWAELLKRVPESRLVIDSGNFSEPEMREAMICNFTALGIAKDRLIIGFHTPPWDVYRGIDIGLDCFPHNSGTTLSETLYMGSPVITLADRPSVGRLGSCLLETIGHPEWIATTEEEYIEIGVNLAKNTDKLKNIRSNLRKEMSSSLLMDEKAFALKVENAFREMFLKWAKDSDSTRKQNSSELVSEAMEHALTCLEDNRNEEAVELLQSVITMTPDHAEAHYRLGILSLKLQDAASALGFFEVAVNSSPEHGPYWIGYITCLTEDKQYETAGQLLETAIDAGLSGEETESLRTIIASNITKPNIQKIPTVSSFLSTEHSNRLITLFEKDSFEECENYARSLLKDFGENDFVLKALGLSLKMQNKFDEAKDILQKTVLLAPEDHEIYHNLGDIFHAQNDYTTARDYYLAALELNPKNAQTHFAIGNTLVEMKDSIKGEESYIKALRLQPDYAEVYFNLGHLYQKQNRFDEALTHYFKAIEYKEDFVKAYSNLGIILHLQRNLKDAELCYIKALSLDPDFTESHINLGACLKDQGKYTEAEGHYREALRTHPDFALCHSNLGSVLKEQGEVEKAEKEFRYALQLDPLSRETHSNLLFLLNYHPDKTGEEIFSEYNIFNSHFGLPQEYAWQPHQNVANPERRLKIAYVSPQFKHHSIRHFLEPLLAHHNRNDFELFAYSETHNEDSKTEQYKSYFDHWIPTAGTTDAELAKQIRSANIDILIDLAGHTGNNRLGMFALKPAPVSLHWLDFGYTTGLTAIDYYLTDNITVPEDSDHLFSEKPWRIDLPSIIYRPAEGMGNVSSLPALERDFITFGLLTRSVRINYKTIRVWAEILKRVKNSVLIIDSSNFQETEMDEKLTQKFMALGIHRERLHFEFHTPPWDIMRGFDLSFDCFPHNSGTTLLETIYMGIPFVTMADRPSVGRLGSAILHALNHQEWIAESEEEYIEIAVRLSSDLDGLSRIRAELRNEMQTSQLMDEESFTFKVESAYKQMFKLWCKGQQ